MASSAADMQQMLGMGAPAPMAPMPPTASGIAMLPEATPPQDMDMDTPLPEGGIASTISTLKDMGRQGDSLIAHLTPGEIVVPKDILDQNPEVQELIFAEMRLAGIEDPQQYIVGSEANSINPESGLPEFFIKELSRKIRRGVRNVGRALKRAAPVVLPLALGAINPFGLGAIASGALTSGIGSLLQGGKIKDAFKSALVGGALGGVGQGLSQGFQTARQGGSFATGFGRGLSQAGTDFTGMFNQAAAAPTSQVSKLVSQQQVAAADMPPNIAVRPSPDQFLPERAIADAGSLPTPANSIEIFNQLPGPTYDRFGNVISTRPTPVPTVSGTAAMENINIRPSVLPEQAIADAFPSPAPSVGRTVRVPAGGATGIQPSYVTNPIEITQANQFLPDRAIADALPIRTDVVGSAAGENVGALATQRTSPLTAQDLSDPRDLLSDFKFYENTPPPPPPPVSERSLLDRTADYMFRGGRSEADIAKEAVLEGRKAYNASKAADLATGLKDQSLIEARAIAASDAAKKAVEPGILQRFGPSVAAGTGIAALGGFFDTPEPDDPRDFYEGAPSFTDMSPEEQARFKVANLTSGPAFSRPFLVQQAPAPIVSQLGFRPFFQPVQFAAKGGEMKTFPRKNGAINGPGTGTSDDVPAMLSDGEFVMTAKAVRGAGNGNRDAGVKTMYNLMSAFEMGAG
jgi:hypothetical protein